ncbi:MAG TPA: ATP synthase subunit I [Acidimicrobiales bacterium]|nr:ATP synthase subunit I [Acidimicrobiales bacterium]
MVNLFSHFSPPQISIVARRTVLVGAGVGAAALVVGVLTGYPLVGLGLCLGLGLALVNFRLVSRATLKAASSPDENKRRPLAVNTLGRLGAISVVALAVTFVLAQLGFGILIGLAVFQFTLLANVVVSMLRQPLMGDTHVGTALPDDEDDL